MERIKINVGGTYFETTKETLSRYPGTPLAELDYLVADKLDDGDEDGVYYFDRDPAVFACILNLYRTKELHVTQALCGNAVRKELAFWKISESVISPCCWRTLHQVDQDKDIMESLRKDQVVIEKKTDFNTCCQSIRYRIWNIMEYPKSSLVAKIWNVILTAMVLLASITYCLDTLPDLRTFPQNGTRLYYIYQYILQTSERNSEKIILFGVQNGPLSVLDTLCLIFFTLELIVHLLVCPNPKTFFRSLLNWVDLLSVISGWTVFIMKEKFNDWFGKDALTVLRAVKGIYIVRLFRVFRLMQSNPNLRIIFLALNECKKELVLLVFSVSVIAVIFASLEYFCEDSNTKFESIPKSIWWAVITMTTVGYGDIVPTTTCGYAIGSVCAFLGILALSLPVAVIATHFSEYYCIHLWWSNHKKEQDEQTLAGSGNCETETPTVLLTRF